MQPLPYEPQHSSVIDPQADNILQPLVANIVEAPTESNPGQLRLSFAELNGDITLYEYAVLVTSLPNEILTIAQLYRDRADCENTFEYLSPLCTG